MKKINPVSFSSGIIAGGIILCAGNMVPVLQGGDSLGMIVGIFCICLGSALFLVLKRKEKNK